MAQTAPREAADASWNRRVAGAGDYQIVLEVSGRIEISRAFQPPNPLDLTDICRAKQTAEQRAFLSADGYLSALEKSADANRRQIEIARLHIELGQIWSYRGDMTQAIAHFEAARAALQKGLLDQPAYAEDLVHLDEILGITYLRKGELDNCVHQHRAENCIFPLSRAAEHKLTAGSSAAINCFKRHLARNPDNLEVRWLLNLAYMTLGQHRISAKGGLAPEWLIPVTPSKDPLPRFPDVAAQLGIDRVSGAGGAILDDFDNDGFLDVIISSVDACESMRFFHNNGDGTFSDQTEKAGLSGQLGGINCVQTDYNNDGWLDVFVMRGGWEFPMRNSLLRNNGDGTFSDVTGTSGLLSGAHRTHSATWADYDNDGWLDVFIGHEETPSQLFRNRGDGTFEDVSARAGVNRTAFTKGAAWGDYDNDGWPDLYVSNYGGANFLYHNDGKGTFTEVANKLNVTQPLMSFPVWWFDYDNDGWQDLFVASFVPSVTEVARGFLGLPAQAETMRLYRNDTKGGFQDVTTAVGLNRVVPTMGANFGDFDNDGWLDVYLGTGAPSYTALMPNFAFRNHAGKSFVDVTAATGTGHLQKGHGVAFGDIDNDGDQDFFVNVGGFIPGDKYNKALFANPTAKSHWLSLKLTGVKSNRAALGARIKLTAADATGKIFTVYRTVSSGGSFGASSLTQNIGFGAFNKIESLEIEWPTSKTRQVFRNVAANQFLAVKELADKFEPRAARIFPLTQPGKPKKKRR
ncbi:MAG: CRTAC1 family protein [Acidobacteria bacterium]|nr:CRTAC1 family protein [Acidobacteriota bacterium]